MLDYNDGNTLASKPQNFTLIKLIMFAERPNILKSHGVYSDTLVTVIEKKELLFNEREKKAKIRKKIGIFSLS